MRRIALAVFAGALLQAVAAQAAPLTPTAEIRTTTGKLVDKDNAEATDLSGLACRPAGTDGWRACVVVDDQDAHAQALMLSPTGIKAGRIIPLARPQAEAVGAPPAPSSAICSNLVGNPGERDGEAVAFDGTWFYVAGSHGCGRNSKKYKTTSLQVARFKLDATGAAMELKNTYRLSEALAASEWAPKFLKDLNGDDGLNVEGFAVVAGQAFVGLRAPMGGGAGRLAIVKTPLAPLFSAGPITAEPISIAFRPALGVRDLSPVGVQHLLILYGPAQNQELPYGLALYDLAARCLVDLGELAPVTGAGGAAAKAEAVLPLTGNVAEGVVVMFDGVAGGGARIYTPSAPGTCAP